jgi:uncharacterized membrane protein YkoI
VDKVFSMRRVLIIFLSMLALGSTARGEETRTCYSAAETREKIASHELAEPFRVMKSAARKLQAEPIGARLCRRQDALVYDISLLRHDGHVIHLFLNATDGKAFGHANE